MNFISRLFKKSPTDWLNKGDRCMEMDSHFDARTCFEEGLQLCSGSGDDELGTLFINRINAANLKLAERNLVEAERACLSGDTDKAIDHLELVKTLTYDLNIREKAEKMLLAIPRTEQPNSTNVSPSSCTSCSGSSSSGCADSESLDESLPPLEYYELLIQQLPIDQYHRYTVLGENFAYAYIAASHDDHSGALAGLEKCHDSVPEDIYWYEKGKILHRVGDDDAAEQHLRKAVKVNRVNSLALFTLAHLLFEKSSYQAALEIIEIMVVESLLPEQALLLRGDIFEVTGNIEGAVNQYVELLQTPYARSAAEKMYGVLMQCGRQNDAAVIFKKYLKKTCH